MRFCALVPAAALLSANLFAADRPATLSEKQKAVHVLNRLGFGPRLGDYEKIKALGARAWIEQQLQPERIPDPVADAKLAPLTTLKMSMEEQAALFPPAALEGDRRRLPDLPRNGNAAAAVRNDPDDRLEVILARRAGRPGEYEYLKAKIIRAVYSERQLNELLVDFWMNHFSLRAKEEFAQDFEEHAIRPNIWGKFETLLKATARHPAMLYYLDNWKSAAPVAEINQRMSALQPDLSAHDRRLLRQRAELLKEFKGLNENYGRELMELHTLGVDGGYTQQDVIEVAKCFTGWTVTEFSDDGVRIADAFKFDPVMHVEGDKTVLGKPIKAHGIEEGVEVLELLARHPSTARFIATKLARRFIADDPPPEVVKAAAETFTRTGGDLREVLRTVLLSPQFLSAQFHQAKFKKPFELVVSSLRAVNADVSFPAGSAQARRRGGAGMNLFSVMNDMGETLYQRITPDGHPDVASAWLNTNALLKRMEFAQLLADNQLADVGVKVDLAAADRLIRQLELPQPTAEQSEKVRLQMAQAVNERMNKKTERKAGGQPMDVAAMMMAGAAPDGGGPKRTATPEAVRVAFALASPQFQKR